MASAATWYDLPWNIATAERDGITHSHLTNPERITIVTAGTYLISYEVKGRYGGPAYSSINARLLLGGTELKGSYQQNTRDYNFFLKQSIIQTIAVNGIIKLQVGTGRKGSDVESYDEVSMPNPTYRSCASIQLIRIA